MSLLHCCRRQTAIYSTNKTDEDSSLRIADVRGPTCSRVWVRRCRGAEVAEKAVRQHVEACFAALDARLARALDQAAAAAEGSSGAVVGLDFELGFRTRIWVRFGDFYKARGRVRVRAP